MPLQVSIKGEMMIVQACCLLALAGFLMYIFNEQYDRCGQYCLVDYITMLVLVLGATFCFLGGVMLLIIAFAQGV